MKSLQPYTYILLPIFVSVIAILAILEKIQSPNINNFEDQSTITVGSSLYASPNKTNYLLSPSGTFAFGFKPLGDGSKKYKIGIWIANSTDKTLVWVPNPSRDEPVEKDSSIVLNEKGEFMIRKVGFMNERLKKSVSSLGLISHAVIQDSGNFVMYNNESEIVWQSFDNPTNTIVQGQTLKSGRYLLSNIPDFSLEMEERGDLVVKGKEFRQGSSQWYYHWRSNTGNKGSPVELKLDGDGRLYIVDWDLRVIKNLTNGEERSAVESIYRATMYSYGIFRLYKERIGSEEAQNSVLLWQSGCIPCDEAREIRRRHTSRNNWVLGLLIGVSVFFIGVVGLWPFALDCRRLLLLATTQKPLLG
ncbi:hypothetical protein ACHQM5_018182 [Ranunculus cassubicifolius]